MKIINMRKYYMWQHSKYFNPLYPVSLEYRLLSIKEKVIYNRLRDFFYAKRPDLFKPEHNNLQTESNLIFSFWQQGEDAAPRLVKSCFESIRNAFSSSDGFKNHTWKLIILDNKNIEEWVDLPEYIKQKFAEGVISIQHYSDIIRTYLLKTYGGIWIDSTVWFANKFEDNGVEREGDIDFFLLQNKRLVEMGLFKTSFCSNWLIYSKANNPIINKIYDFLLVYWQYNQNCYYFLWHIIFAIICNEIYPEKYKKIPLVDSIPKTYLLSKIYKKYSNKKFDSICSKSNYFKLTWRVKDTKKIFTNYDYVLTHKSFEKQ